MSKNQKGITMISLVITIIVLIILAGISIKTLTGDNGTIGEAEESIKNAERESIIQKIDADLYSEKVKNGTKPTRSKLIEIINSKYGTVDSETQNSFVSKDRNYTINFNELEGWIDESGEGELGQVPISIEVDYMGCYADFTGPEGKPDGVPDGIIYADLAFSTSGQWVGYWEDDWGDNWGVYSWTKKAGLKEYTVSTEDVEGGFGDYTAKVITPKEGTTGEDRFYVMALQDHTPGTYYKWYYAAYGKLDNALPYTGDGSYDFGQGKIKTKQMIAKWNEENSSYGAKNAGSDYTDLWGIFYDKNNTSGIVNSDNWFVPSKGEWSAFGNCVYTKVGVTKSNYPNYSLSPWYWSSSQNSTNDAYGANFSHGYIYFTAVSYYGYCVRLSATF